MCQIEIAGPLQHLLQLVLLLAWAEVVSVLRLHQVNTSCQCNWPARPCQVTDKQVNKDMFAGTAEQQEPWQQELLSAVDPFQLDC